MEEIILNGKTYVLKEEVEQLKEEIELQDVAFTHFVGINHFIKGLEGTARNKGLFYTKTIPTMPITEIMVDSISEFGIMDPSNCVMVVAKTQPAKMFLKRYKAIDDTIDKVPSLTVNTKAKAFKSWYGIELINQALMFLNVNSDSVKINMYDKDYPMCLENDDFKIFIAPRVDEGE